MPPIVSKLKGKNMFSVLYAYRLFAVLLPLALSIFPSPLTVTKPKLEFVLRPLYTKEI
jgi:hypothetical protein